jgi:hypothetical protein
LAKSGYTKEISISTMALPMPNKSFQSGFIPMIIMLILMIVGVMFIVFKRVALVQH